MEIAKIVSFFILNPPLLVVGKLCVIGFCKQDLHIQYVRNTLNFFAFLQGKMRSLENE